MGDEPAAEDGPNERSADPEFIAAWNGLVREVIRLYVPDEWRRKVKAAGERLVEGLRRIPW